MGASAKIITLPENLLTVLPLLQVNDPAKRERYALAEIKHARLAMLAFSGMVHQYFITKQTVFEQLGNFRPINGFPDVTYY